MTVGSVPAPLKEAYYFYSIDRERFIKTKKQRKNCLQEKCSLWRGTDSEGLVWCNEWNIGDCSHFSDEYGKPYGELWVPLEVYQKLEIDFNNVSECAKFLQRENERLEEENKQAIGMLERYTYLADTRQEKHLAVQKILNESPTIDCPMEDAGNDECIGFIVDFATWLERLRGVLHPQGVCPTGASAPETPMCEPSTAKAE